MENRLMAFPGVNGDTLQEQSHRKNPETESLPINWTQK